ncbi:unnamed protein product [Lactuca virosa]|uniref:Uncharacterized protein n=1 Tax=Lactuca virosa TaxID=75947 RepID=A0AAU9MR22_9ASTR|nr:unnamed protein product [Lactuca virosa]
MRWETNLVESLPLLGRRQSRAISTTRFPINVVDPTNNPSDVLFNEPVTALSKHDKSNVFESVKDSKDGILYGIGDHLVRRKAQLDAFSFVGGGAGLPIAGRLKKIKVFANLHADFDIMRVAFGYGAPTLQGSSHIRHGGNTHPNMFASGWNLTANSRLSVRVNCLESARHAFPDGSIADIEPSDDQTVG